MNRIRGIAVAACVVAFGLAGVSRAAELVLTEDTEVTVEEGQALVYESLGGTAAFTLTKKGAGLLEIRRVTNAKAKVVIAEGEVRFANPRPDDVFAKAYFHVDATDTSSMTIETVNGTNFVTRWNDADGRAQYASHCTTVWNCRTDPDTRKPYLTENGQNGLPVMDFGSLLTKYNTNELGQALGYGAAMKFNQTTPEIYDAFTVAADSDDVAEWPKRTDINLDSMCGQSYFSHETSYTCVRRAYYLADISKGGPGLLADNSQNNPWNNGNIWFDGTLVSGHPKWVYPKPGFHFVHMKPTGETLTSFAAEYIGSSNRSYGGTKIAEYVIFTNVLDEADSEQLNRYLGGRWLPQTLASVCVQSGARLTVDESNLRLTIVDYIQQDGADVNVSEGQSVTFDTIGDLDVVAHFDASVLSSLVTNEVNGTNFISRWKSLNDPEGLFATNYWGHLYSGGIPAFRPDPENRLPYLAVGASQTGLSAVDFGSYLSSADVDGSEGYGAAFQWSKYTAKADKEMAEFFTVAADDEQRGTKTKPVGVGSYVGSVSTEGAGIRGKNGQLFHDVSAGDVRTLTTKAQFIYLDNDLGSTTNDYTRIPSPGFHVVNAVPGYKINMSAFAHGHRTSAAGTTANGYGGMKIGEFIALNTAIADGSHRDLVNRHLMHKWLGAPRGVRTYRSVEIPKEAALEVVYEDVVVANLTLGGTLKAEKITASNLKVTATDTAIVGTFVLGESPAFSFAQIGETAAVTSLSVGTLDLGAAPGKITVSVANAKALRGQKAKLIGFESVVGTLDGWTVESNYDVGVSVALEADGLYATFGKPGMMLIFK